MTSRRERPTVQALTIIGLAFALGACSEAPVPTGEMASARAAIANAQDEGAEQLAPQDLQLAKSKLARAQDSITAGHNEDAKRWAEQSLVDAQFAGASADSQRIANTAGQLSDVQRRLQPTSPGR